MDFLNQHPLSTALKEGSQVAIVGLPEGGYAVRVGSGAAAAYYLAGDTTTASQAEFNQNQFRYLFS